MALGAVHCPGYLAGRGAPSRRIVRMRKIAPLFSPLCWFYERSPSRPKGVRPKNRLKKV